MLYMVTFTINIPPMLAYIPAPWILWEIMAIINFCHWPRWPGEAGAWRWRAHSGADAVAKRKKPADFGVMTGLSQLNIWLVATGYNIP